jgi:hypothetical protein
MLSSNSEPFHSHRGFSPVGVERKEFLNRFNGFISLAAPKTVQTVQ